MTTAAPAPRRAARTRRGLASCLLALLALVLSAADAFAHEVRPAYLQIRQTGEELYEVLWKVPAAGRDLRLGIDVVLPEGARTVREPTGFASGGAFVQTWSVERRGGLDGGTVRIDGLTSTVTDVLARVERLDGSAQVVRLTPAAPSFTVESARGAGAVVSAYVALGVEHILTGWDHLLYVLALLLLVRGGRRLLGAMTAFTATHSLTLAAATLGWVSIPQPPVEVCIALSIVFVACEIVRSREGRPGLAERRPWLVSFAFGLLHGLGFAGALHDVGLPTSSIPAALISFNLGVEIGQIAFVAAALVLWRAGRAVAARLRLELPSWGWRVAPYALGTTAAFWCLQRLAAF